MELVHGANQTLQTPRNFGRVCLMDYYVMCLMRGQTNARESGKQHGLIIFKHIRGRGTKTPEFFAAMRIPLRRWFIIPFKIKSEFPSIFPARL